MKNLKIKFKILWPMLALLLIVTASNIFLTTEMSKINDQSNIIAERWLPSVESSLNMNLALSTYRRSQYGLLLSFDPKEIQTFKDRMANAVKELDKQAKEYEALPATEEETQLYKQFQSAWADYQKMSDVVDDLKQQGKNDEATQMVKDGKKIYDVASDSIQKIVDINMQGSADSSAYAERLFNTDRSIAIGLTVLLFAFGMFIVFTLVKAVATPVNAITAYMNYLAAGNLDKDVPSRELKDEIGDMARSVQVFKDNMVKAKELEAEQHTAEIAKQKRQENVNNAVKRFQMSMSDIVRFVSSASTELQASSQSLSASAEETSKQSGAVAAASQQAAANVQTVASATEELSSSINEISSQVSRSSAVAAKAVQDAEQAGANVAELVEAAQKIGDVTKIISGIAEQTNLLALNATIEAARAGDAGKGFAVVASEVKNLANESTKATEEIAGQIAHIQQISQTSAEAINMICRVIREIDEISGIISAAIQEQTSATQEISRNVGEAYTGTSEVTQNIGSVSQAANTTGESAHEVLSAADELSRQSEILKEEFDTFIHSLEAA